MDNLNKNVNLPTKNRKLRPQGGPPRQPLPKKTAQPSVNKVGVYAIRVKTG